MSLRGVEREGWSRRSSSAPGMTRPVADPPAPPQNHSFTYDEPIKVESVTQAVCDLALRFGEGADEEEATMVRSPPSSLSRY